MPAGAPEGNQNAIKGKMWRSAIMRALSKRAKGDQVKALDDLAEKFLAAVETGDITAFRELGDRLDGKAAQMIIGDAENPVAIQSIAVEFVKPK
jgi:DNA-binding GntR family transcriptional regulator